MFTHKVPVSVYVHCYFEIRLRRKNNFFYWILNFMYVKYSTCYRPCIIFSCIWFYYMINKGFDVWSKANLRRRPVGLEAIES